MQDKSTKGSNHMEHQVAEKQAYILPETDFIRITLMSRQRRIRWSCFITSVLRSIRHMPLQYALTEYRSDKEKLLALL